MYVKKLAKIFLIAYFTGIIPIKNDTKTALETKVPLLKSIAVFNWYFVKLNCTLLKQPAF